MSRRDMPDHLRRQRVHAALMHAAQQHPTLEAARASAKSFLRGQSLRVTDAELDEVAGMRLSDILWPPCECMPLNDQTLFRGATDKEDPGPHHNVACPKWRAVRP